MLRTNNKQVRSEIRKHIMEYSESYETFESNAKAVCNPRNENYLFCGAKKLAEDGEFMYSSFDIRAFIEAVLEQTSEESAKYNDVKVFSLYCYLIGAEGSRILRNGGWVK